MKERGVVWLKLAVHGGALVPLALLLWRFWQGKLGPDPVGDMSRLSGRYALIFLLLSLTPTVIALVSGFRGVLRVRRLLGLYAFMYAGLHFLVFVGLDYGFDLRLIWLGITEGRFILLGLTALLLLVPLAVTSTSGWIRRLGKNWRRLHRLSYLASALVVLHYAWAFKELRSTPLIAGAALALMLLLRLPPIRNALARRRPTAH